MAAEETYLTKEGEDKLRRELRRLKERERPSLLVQLSRGREAGKLRENADYDDARERLWILDARIKRIERSLSGSILLEPDTNEEESQLRLELWSLSQIELPLLGEKGKRLDERLREIRTLAEEYKLEREGLRSRRKLLQENLKRYRSQSPNHYRKLKKYISLKKDFDRLTERSSEIQAVIGLETSLKKQAGTVRKTIGNHEARIRAIQVRLENRISRSVEAELKEELKRLVEVRRPEFARKLQAARAQGDLKENADYHDAKDQLGFIEGKIQQLEATLRNAIIVEDAGTSAEARIGSTVIIEEKGSAESEEYQIVGPLEANPREGKISYESPIGAALLGKKAGARVKVKTPGGQIKLKILEIR